MSDHCFHMLSMAVLPPRKGRPASSLSERCCWCGAIRDTVRVEVPDETHGPFLRRSRAVTHEAALVTYRDGDAKPCPSFQPGKGDSA